MSTEIYKSWTSSNEGSFDIKDKKPIEKDNSNRFIPTVESYNPEVNAKVTPAIQWELDVRGMVPSKKWLMQYGLKKNRLDLKSLLASLGFRQNENFDRMLKKPVTSKYGESLFLKHSLEDGSVYNIVAKKEQLKQVEQRLQQAINLYKRRLEWLTTESRRIFGVIQEHCMTIILDIKNLSPRQFDQYLCAMERVLREQISQVAKFNLIRCAEEMERFSPECVPVSNDTIELAIDWLWKLDRLAPTGVANTTEAVVRASVDPNNEAVYLFTEGNSSDQTREILREKVRMLRVPLHVVSFNCNSQDVIGFLRDLCVITGGRFHAYAVTMEVDSYEGLPVDPENNKANIVVRRKLYGGVPPGAGTREDCLAIFEEMEEARNLLSQIQVLLSQTPDPKMQYGSPNQLPVERDELNAHQRREEYMSSREWLERFGLRARKLDFYDVLAGISFRHCDGVVDVMQPPEDAAEDIEFKSDPLIQPKLINAKYCDKFAHVRWKDGRVVHVQMTPEVHRLYEQRMSVALSAIRRRIDWLRQGSRELFGTIVEEQVYILVDTSSSMEPSIQFVKDKLHTLMQEQLRHKTKINFVAFNSKAHPWKDRLVDVTESNLQSAWMWLKALTCYGSTNTLTALKFALSDRQTHAIYLLSDGRPDHPPKTVLSQVMLHNRIPVHAISFNCADKEANDFLCTLAKETGGRFHYFSETGDKDPEAPDAWESEDIRLLKDEYDQGMQNLEKVSRLREECHRLAWNRDTHKKETASETDGTRSHRSLDSERPKSAPSIERGAHAGHRQRSLKPLKVSRGPRVTTHESRRVKSRADKLQALVQSHTRTSLLRTLNSSGQFRSDEWLLPETRDMMERQAKREQEILENEERARRSKAHKKKTADLTDQSKLRIRSWLRIYGLIPQRLTILDVLAPTVVEQRPKYVPILDKEVLSRVFDDVLPIAHISKARKGGISLVNPNAVNLTGYREKLTEAIARYQKKLKSLITSAIGQAEVNQILEQSGDPELDINLHRSAILEALERTGWKVAETDIQLLEKEISVAQKYYAQAEDLERAGRQEAERSKKEEIASTGEGFGQILKMQPGDPQPTKKDPDGKSVKRVLDSLRGQYVIARDDRDGLYYEARVARCPNVRIALVEFEDLKNEDEMRSVPTRFCIPISGAIARPSLQLQDTALVRCNNADNGRVCYAPGIITQLPSNARAQAKFYTVKLFTGKKCQSQRGDIVKIGQTRYNFIVQSLYEKSSKNVVPDDTKEAKDDMGTTDKGSEKSLSQRETPSLRRENDSGSFKDSGDELTRDNADSYRSNKTGHNRTSEDRQKRSTASDNGAFNAKIHEYENKLVGTNKAMEKLKSDFADQQKEMTQRQKKLKKELRKMKTKDKKLKKTESQLLEHDRMIKDLQEKFELRLEKPRSRKSSHGDEIPTDRTGDEIPTDRSRDEIPTDRSRDEIPTDRSRDEIPTERARDEIPTDKTRDEIPTGRTRDETPTGRTRDETFEETTQEAPVQDLIIGEEVLARWLDDGWYYRGMVKEWLGDGSYTIEDGCRQCERIWREDIIRDREDIKDILSPNQTVVALHPRYSFSYAPGVVTKVLPNLWLEVRFYDGVEVRLPREECYQLSNAKFEAVVRYIVTSEKQWVGQAVVARDNLTGTFHLSQVKQRVGNGKQYIIEWADGRLSTQTAEFIFGAFTRRHQLRNGDRVLACADLKSLTYLPGWVCSTSPYDDKISVRFCNGVNLDNVDVMHSFWLSQQFYEQSVRYWKKHTNR